MHNLLLDKIYESNPHQKKKIEPFLENEEVLNDLKIFLDDYRPFMEKFNVTLDSLAKAYLQLVDDMCSARLEFVRSGRYPRSSQSEATVDVYNNRVVMTNYMLGLALSQFLWKQHYSLFNFYRREIRKIVFKKNDLALEVGCGHGLFLKELLLNANLKMHVDAVDISKASIDLSHDIVSIMLKDYRDLISFHHSDILKFSAKNKYSFITMGEVLEHVEDPRSVLRIISSLLSPDGRAYISTCANCPAIDHVFHFHTIDEIKELITSEGFRIESEVIEPVENCSQEKLIKRKIDILYAAIITKERQSD